MSRKQVNSSWLKWTLGIQTDQKKVEDALGDESIFKNMMIRYERIGIGYLTAFLVQYEGLDGAAARVRANAVWAEVLQGMPAKLAKKWSAGGTKFRDLLLEGVHEANYRWQKLASTTDLIKSDAARQNWLRAQREGMLDRARERLQAQQRRNTQKKELSYAIFCLWEQRGEKESQAALNAKLITMKGMRPVSQVDFRKQLGRARDLFGKFLFDEVETWVRERDDRSLEKLRHAFEELGLMEEYAMNSKTCRSLLGLTK